MLFKKIKINKKLLILLFVLFLFLFVLIVYQTNQRKKNYSLRSSDLFSIRKVIDLVNPLVEIEGVRLLDGLATEYEQRNNRPVAVLIDNYPGAPRPSISSASVVYQMPVEGGMTRFLAIFDPNDLPEDSGPIRSARPYFAELAEEYKAVFVHAGGSPEVLLKLRQGFYQVIDLNEISWQGKYFWRSQGSAPHNLYIRKEQIDNFLDEQKIDKKIELDGWRFGYETMTSQGEAINVKINFSKISTSDWRYNSEEEAYQLFKNGQIYRDKDGKEILVKNLIVQLTKIIVLDSVGRRRIELSGSGEAFVFQKGTTIPIRWSKEINRTRFYNIAGEEIIMLPGKTWVSIVSSVDQVSY